MYDVKIYFCIKYRFMKSRRDRFEEIATRRVQYILNKLDNLGNCANTNNYEYSEQDVNKMFTAIRNKLRITESKFKDGLKTKTGNKFEF